MKRSKGRVAFLACVLFVLGNCPLIAQESVRLGRNEDWVSSVLSLVDQINLLAIEDSAESLHRLELRRESFAVDSDNKEAMIAGLREILQDHDVPEGEKTRVEGDINVEQHALELRRAHEVLVQKQVANFEDLKSNLERNSATIRETRQSLGGESPEHSSTQATVLQLFSDLTSTMHRLTLFQMETRLVLTQAPEVEFLSLVRSQERVAEVYREILSHGDTTPGEHDYERNSLLDYEIQSEREKAKWAQFHKQRQEIERAIDSLHSELANSVKSALPPMLPDTAAEEHQLLVQLHKMKVELLEEVVTDLGQQKNAVLVAKAGIERIIEERADVNQRMVLGPEGLIYRTERMEPPAGVRVDELDEQSKRLEEKLEHARKEASDARIQANQYDIQGLN